MIDRILRDSELRPDPFFWTGKLSLMDIEEWERAESISLPQDLKRLWNIKGGGELFESETILTPLPPSNEDDPGPPRYEEDLVLPRSRWFWGKDLDRDCYVFHEGWCVSVFRKSDHSLCSFKDGRLQPSRSVWNVG